MGESEELEAWLINELEGWMGHIVDGCQPESVDGITVSPKVVARLILLELDRRGIELQLGGETHSLLCWQREDYNGE